LGYFIVLVEIMCGKTIIFLCGLLLM